MYTQHTPKLVTLTVMILGCGGAGGGNGNLQILLGAEETIREGLQSGDGDEHLLDGFNVEFDNYIVSVGNVEMSMGGARTQADDTVIVVDLTNLPTAGLTLIDFTGIPTGQYDEFGYETPAPTLDALDQGVGAVDFQAMVDNGWSYLIRGVLRDDGGTPGDESDDGQLVEQRFEIGADVPGVYTFCGAEEAQVLGVSVSTNSSAELTIHGDHIFFNGFPEEEGTTRRLGQWMADVDDTNDDGVLTRVDFEAATDLGSLFPSSQYELTGGPLLITSAWDFVRAQLGTQGHIQGEGECAWSDL